MQIDYLKNKPEFIDEIARAWQAEWIPDKSNAGFEKIKSKILGMLNDKGIPLILVAFGNKEICGSAAIFVNDLDSRPDLTPWLAGVYVVDKYRGRGIARSLIESIKKEAGRLGFKKLYLHTEHVCGLYEKLGAEKLFETKNDFGEPTTVYKLSI